MIRRGRGLVLLGCNFNPAHGAVERREAVDSLLLSLQLPDEDREPARQKARHGIFDPEPEQDLTAHIKGPAAIRHQFREPRACRDHQVVGDVVSGGCPDRYAFARFLERDDPGPGQDFGAVISR